MINRNCKWVYWIGICFVIILVIVEGNCILGNRERVVGNCDYVLKNELLYEDVVDIGQWQDGAIWNEKLFVLNENGIGMVYDLYSYDVLDKFVLDKKDVLVPHANSVCFGNNNLEDTEYPFLYVNVYNNYKSAVDRMEGTCCVYQIDEIEGQFSTRLIQVIRIGFVENLSQWKSLEDNGDVRPYGNFVVDINKNELYAYVMRDKDRTTRFFRLDLPKLDEGEYSEIYDCNVVTLDESDILSSFDVEYFNYLQGCTYWNNSIISVEGFNSGGSAEPVLRVVDLSEECVIKRYNLAEFGLVREPEVVCIDSNTGYMYYVGKDGMLRRVRIYDTQ